MKALITGITGFAGSHLAEHLLECGDHLLGSARAARWPAEVPPGLQQVPLVGWDLSDPQGLSSAAKRECAEFGPQVIYHLAACSVPAACGQSEPTPDAQATNVEGARRVLQFAAALPSLPRVLLVSTRHVYGPPTTGRRVDESAPLAPSSGYGITKLQAEQLAHQAVADGQDIVIARAFQHAGPRQRKPMMLVEWTQQLAAGADPVVVHNLQTTIDLTDVRDIVRAYRLLAMRGRSGETYNVGSGSRQTTGEIFQALRGLADPERPWMETDPGPRHDPIADVRRLRKTTGWRPRIPILTTLADTYSYWLRAASAGMLPPRAL